MNAPWKIYHHCPKVECDHHFVTDPPELADRFEIVHVPGPAETMSVQVNSNNGWSGWDVIEPAKAPKEAEDVQ